jgi:hypothetical protein
MGLQDCDAQALEEEILGTGEAKIARLPAAAAASTHAHGDYCGGDDDWPIDIRSFEDEIMNRYRGTAQFHAVMFYCEAWPVVAEPAYASPPECLYLLYLPTFKSLSSVCLIMCAHS